MVFTNENLMGIFEVTGSFIVRIIKNDKYSSGHSVSINFTIQNKDHILLDNIFESLRQEKIYSKINGDKLIVNGVENLTFFIDFIKENNGFISDSRRKEFEHWSKIVDLYDCDQHLFSEGIKSIKYQKGKMK